LTSFPLYATIIGQKLSFLINNIGKIIKGNKVMKKTINRMVVLNVTSKYSPKNQEYYNHIDLVDPDDDFRWYQTYVSEENRNYAQWRKILEQDTVHNAFVIEGNFRRKHIEKRIVSADAGFVISEIADRELILDLIAQQIGAQQ
jgi:hypothetical protein